MTATVAVLARDLRGREMASQLVSKGFSCVVLPYPPAIDGFPHQAADLVVLMDGTPRLCLPSGLCYDGRSKGGDGLGVSVLMQGPFVVHAHVKRH